jgi:hypothetical protein
MEDRRDGESIQEGYAVVSRGDVVLAITMIEHKEENHVGST